MVERPSGDPIKAAQRSPSFFQDPAMDMLVRMNIALAEEIAVLSEKLANCEKLLSQKGVVDQRDFDECVLDETEKHQRLAAHQSLMDRLLAPVQAEIDKLK